MNFTSKLENESQYNWAVSRVDELLPLVNDNTPENDPNYIELILLSNLVADYSEEHFSL
ncbi:MAG: XRE family transcriptional regulator [Bacteroides sp.]|nr:XRE family transcriptional regulator [Bacteroides sp.]